MKTYEEMCKNKSDDFFIANLKMSSCFQCFCSDFNKRAGVITVIHQTDVEFS